MIDAVVCIFSLCLIFLFSTVFCYFFSLFHIFYLSLLLSTIRKPHVREKRETEKESTDKRKKIRIERNRPSTHNEFHFTCYVHTFYSIVDSPYRPQTLMQRPCPQRKNRKKDKKEEIVYIVNTLSLYHIIFILRFFFVRSHFHLAILSDFIVRISASIRGIRGEKVYICTSYILSLSDEKRKKVEKNTHISDKKSFSLAYVFEIEFAV